MSGEKILLVCDSLEGPTGFANNGLGIAWALAKEFDVSVLGLQSWNRNEVRITYEGEQRTVIQYPNVPRKKDTEWDFGFLSLPKLLDELEPDILLTINDIQMVQHVPNVLCPDSINIKLVDLPARKFLSEDAIRMQLEGKIEAFKEKYPRNTKWVMLAPQDGEPPIPNWKFIYAMADKVVAMSRYGQYVFKKYFNMDVPYIWHGVDGEVFRPEEKPKELEKYFIVGDINRNQPRKQPIRVIQAFAKFAKGKDDVRLWLQKDWNDRFGWPLSYFVSLYGIGDKIIPPKPVGIPRREVAKIYNSWDVNLMATGGEGFGLPFIEGFLCGKPTITVKYTTGEELVNYGNPKPRGLFAKYSLHWQTLDVAAVQRSLVDVDDLAKQMERYYQDRELLAKHGENAEIWARKNVTMKKLQWKWIDLMKEVLNT